MDQITTIPKLVTVEAVATVNRSSYGEEETKDGSGLPANDRFATTELLASQDPESELTTLTVTIEGTPATGEPVAYTGVVQGLLEQIIDGDVQLTDCTPRVNQAAVDELAQDLASQLHATWQEENREAYAVRRKPTSDEDWIDKAMADAVTVTLSQEEADSFKKNPNEDALYDKHPALEDLGPGQAAIFVDPQGERLGVYVDIMATDYNQLPQEWQQDNLDSAASAAQMIAEALAIGEAIDLEVISDQIHEFWLANKKAKGGWVPDEQDCPFEELSEEDKERDRVIAKQVLARLD